VKQLFCAIVLITLAGCGSDGNVRAVTPVMADTRGTYRLLASSSTLKAPDGSVTSFVSYSGGTLRLTETNFTRSVGQNGAVVSRGTYALGASVNTILNTRDGSFALVTSNPPFAFTGSYHVIPDFTLTLNYNPFALPDQTVITRSDTWTKESDSPQQ
jgi:hypothetical protein